MKISRCTLMLLVLCVAAVGSIVSCVAPCEASTARHCCCDTTQSSTTDCPISACRLPARPSRNFQMSGLPDALVGVLQAAPLTGDRQLISVALALSQHPAALSSRPSLYLLDCTFRL